MLRTITNHYLDVQVFDTDPSAARGPFVVVQEGCAPGDDTATEKIFVLKHDGAWADVTYYLAGGGKGHIGEIVFSTMGEVMERLGNMAHKVKVSPERASEEEIAFWKAEHPNVSADLEGLKRWAWEFRRKAAEQW